MTDTERNTALAALFGADGYEAATECPQGHEVEECEIGELCPHCDWDTAVVPIPDSYWEASRLCKAAEWMPDWHQEWRIQPAPRDFTVPGLLEPLAEQLLEKWNTDPEEPYYMWVHYCLPLNEDVTHRVIVYHFFSHPPTHLVFSDGNRVASGEGLSYAIALGEALLNTTKLP